MNILRKHLKYFRWRFLIILWNTFQGFIINFIVTRSTNIKIFMIFIFSISLFLCNFQFTCTPISFLFCFGLVYIQFDIFYFSQKVI